MWRVCDCIVAGTLESPTGQLKEISGDVEAWDVRNSFGESSQIVESQIPYHDDTLNFPSGPVGDKLISLAGYRHIITTPPALLF